eukprot:CAMPEP_0195645378 /NCGR_PEP_ID=MMETSP0815-20121206/28907_1 /TAXON_ID=97485 /ORGANISM="Prymnesium parvum, Strain Texoma1" /LENGTH=34 /DNA_ID= /DNA_START= /DNA_END= /DNA_ORIENTATION=
MATIVDRSAWLAAAPTAIPNCAADATTARASSSV